MPNTQEKTSLLPWRTLGNLMGRDLEDWFSYPFRDIMRPFGKGMTDLYSDLFGNGETELPLNIQPAVNMHVDGNNLMVEVMLPGLKKEELKLETTANMLSITGEAKREKEVKKEDLLCRQFSSTRKYDLKLTLPVEIKAEKAEASLNNGILTVKLPTVETIQAQKVNIAVK